MVSKLVSKTEEEKHEKSSKKAIWRGVDISNHRGEVGRQNFSWEEARWLAQHQTIFGEDRSDRKKETP